MFARHAKSILRTPLAWGGLYLAIVPIFALLYVNMSESFSQSTLRSEPTRLSTDFQTFVDQLVVYLFGHARPSDATQGSIAEVILRGTFSNGSTHSLDGNYRFIRKGGYGEWPLSFALTVNRPFFDVNFPENSSPTTFTLAPEGPHGRSEVEQFLSNVDFEVPGAKDMSVLISSVGDSTIAFTPPHPLLAMYERFIAARDGDPTAAGDAFWRMFYFSTVTITTLGYGDITPTTEGARAAVSVEVILGVVVIGLFLNAIGLRVAERRSMAAS